VRERQEINMSIGSYRDLLVWQKAMGLVVECYRITTLLPKNETYAWSTRCNERRFLSPLISLRDTVETTWAITSLIHLSVANGLLMELETHLWLLPRLSYLKSSELENGLRTTDEIGKMLSGLSKSLRKTNS